MKARPDAADAHPVRLATLAAFLLVPAAAPAPAATSIFANSESTVDSTDSTTHAPRYDGAGGDIEVGVCIVPGTPFANDMVRPVRNAIATWNGLRPTSANARRGLTDKLDFESVLLHEMGHDRRRAQRRHQCVPLLRRDQRSVHAAGAGGRDHVHARCRRAAPGGIASRSVPITTSRRCRSSARAGARRS